MADSGWLQWAYLLATTATGMSIVMIAQTANSYWAAYKVAPQEVASFIDTLDFSIEENEGYDRDVSKVQRLEDKIRLNRLLREIQKIGDDLRDELSCLVLEEGATTLRTSSRLMWASKRSQLEERMRRLETLRMRFMMVYLGIITSIAEKQPPPPPPPPPPPLPKQLPDKTTYTTPTRPSAKKSFDDLHRRTPTRRLTTQAIGHNEHVETPQRSGWAGVVQELQMSPRMRARHASSKSSWKARHLESKTSHQLGVFLALLGRSRSLTLPSLPPFYYFDLFHIWFLSRPTGYDLTFLHTRNSTACRQ